jgi:hypothetical protein
MSQWQTLLGHPVLRLQADILTAPSADRMSEKRSARAGGEVRLSPRPMRQHFENKPKRPLERNPHYLDYERGNHYQHDK